MVIRRLCPRFVLTAPAAATVRLHRAIVSCSAAADGTYTVLSRALLAPNEPLTLELLSGDVQCEIAVRVLGCRPVLEGGEALYELSLEPLQQEIVFPQLPPRPTTVRTALDR